MSTSSYNLLCEKWIPVLYSNGKVDRVGILQALTGAHQIRLIAASNPMDRVALLRFLLAVLMWCKEDAKSSLAELDESSAGIPENWLAKLEANRAAFNLLGDGKRFYQDASLQNKIKPRPIGDLLVEFPGANSVNHMRHVVYDDSYGFCPACCAMGILRLSVWAPANGHYPASVNPGSAAYALIEERNLLHTLCANLPEKNPQVDQAPWLSNKQPDSPDTVALLAWRPRKFWLNNDGENGPCANCGQIGTPVKTLSIERGWPTPVTRGQQFGKDVLAEFQKINNGYKSKETKERRLANKVVKVAQLIGKCRMAALDAADTPAAAAPNPEPDEQKIARVFHQLFTAANHQAIKELTKKATKQEAPHLRKNDTQVKKFWDEDPHLLKDAEALGLPDLNADAGIQASRFWRDALRLRGQRQGKVSAIGPVVNDFTFQDATSVSVPNEAASQRVERSASIREGLRSLVKCTTPNKKTGKDDHPEVNAAVVLAIPDAESRLRAALKQPDAEVDKFLWVFYEPVVEQIVASVTPGSPLRRRAALKHAEYLLNNKIKELVEKPDQPSNADAAEAAPGKAKRGRKKGGSK
ncbi:MAG: hypothetical protein GMKNLPBB_01304 [Myxococcota bacterium]|nr:hypothetical protein [Myxococcota bacterium]